LTGIFSGDYKVGVDYRTQWGSITNPFNTFSASYETRILVNHEIGDYLSFGVGAFYDKAGATALTTTEIMPTIAYNKAISDVHNSYLSVGFSAGYLNRSVDMSKMTFTSQFVNGSYSSSNPSGETAPFKSLHHYDLAAGVSWNSSLDRDNVCNYYIGASLFHINHPTEIFNGGYTTVKLPMKWQASGGINLVFSEHWSLSGHINYSKQDPYTETIYGGLLTYHNVTPGLSSNFAFSFGAFNRSSDALVPIVKMDIDNVSVGVSYDMTNSTLATGSSSPNATEVSLYIRGNYKHNTNPRDGVMCPRFEQPLYYPFKN